MPLIYLNAQHVYINEKILKRLRADGFYDWAALVFIIYMFSLQQADSFQEVPLPYLDPVG